MINNDKIFSCEDYKSEQSQEGIISNIKNNLSLMKELNTFLKKYKFTRNANDVIIKISPIWKDKFKKDNNQFITMIENCYKDYMKIINTLKSNSLKMKEFYNKQNCFKNINLLFDVNIIQDIFFKVLNLYFKYSKEPICLPMISLDIDNLELFKTFDNNYDNWETVPMKIYGFTQDTGKQFKLLDSIIEIRMEQSGDFIVSDNSKCELSCWLELKGNEK